MATPRVVSAPPTIDQVTKALAGVNDPEIRRPITELGMVKDIDVAADGSVRVDVWLPVAGCPRRATIPRELAAAVSRLDGVRRGRAEMVERGNEALPVRGPILHRLLEQFLADVWWGDLDVLLMDLPPGTGDVAISAAHLVPGSELIVVTTPQLASSEVAERAGSLAAQLHQRVVGVIENMSYLPCPHCGERVEVFV